MLRRLLFVLVAAVTVLAVSVRKEIPSAIRSVESIFRPVLHKEIVNRYSGIYKEDPIFVTALIKVESKFLSKAKSPRGAVGLMQIMPNTGREIAQELKLRGFQESNLEDPETNIRFGFHHISKLRKEFGDDDATVLAAYNAGGKNVKDWLKARGGKRLEIVDIEFPETRNFAEDVLSTYRWLKRFQKWRKKIMNLGSEGLETERQSLLQSDRPAAQGPFKSR
jgi:soluble lytic murein transglycosylase